MLEFYPTSVYIITGSSQGCPGQKGPGLVGVLSVLLLVQTGRNSEVYLPIHRETIFFSTCGCSPPESEILV